MKPEELQQDKKYIYISPKPWSKTHTITYTGTARDVKDLLHWFFRTADDSTIFLNADEVKTLFEDKLQINDAPTPETDSYADRDWWTLFRANEHARELERERNYYKWHLHIAKGEIEEARKMERAWKKEETNE
jgi:hypothetical protein